MTVVRRRGVTWAAAKDGLAHAREDGAVNSRRALCGAVPIADRYAWPIGRFCAVCWALEQGRKRAKGAAIAS